MPQPFRVNQGHSDLYHQYAFLAGSQDTHYSQRPYFNRMARTALAVSARLGGLEDGLVNVGGSVEDITREINQNGSHNGTPVLRSDKVQVSERAVRGYLEIMAVHLRGIIPQIRGYKLNGSRPILVDPDSHPPVLMQ